MRKLRKRGFKTPHRVRKAQQTLRKRSSSKAAKNRARAVVRGWNRSQRGKSPKIQAVHHGILEVPRGKSVMQLPLKHFIGLAERKGYAAISRALTNLQRWNSNRNKRLSNWAKRTKEKLRAKVARRRNPKTLHHVSTGAYRPGSGQRIRTITFGKGIKARIAYPKGSRKSKKRAKRGKGKGVIITLLFDPSRYTLEEAKEWARDHGYRVKKTAAAGTTKPRKKTKKHVKATRCKGKTGSGKRCTRNVTGRRKYCWQHGR